ncbi:hypothetical protein [Amycolatopsis sp. MtRt-6]|uniref:hypothetical protein n=1 Tax=Amycolatopsis sp. MtRt-6 TaxID=2792782 RepID=UPI001A8D2B4D|nr:hypothetical protein [Amycolatopsis sp. MtRt-6]
MKTRWDPDGPGWQPAGQGPRVTVFSMACLAVALVSFGGLIFLGVTFRDRAGSVVVPATVERALGVGRFVARVGEPGGGRPIDVRTDTKYDRRTRKTSGPGYVPGRRIEVRYWPGTPRMATDTAGEVRLPGAWIFAVPAVGLLLGIAGLRVQARRPLRPRSA